MNGKNEVQLIDFVGQDLKETRQENGSWRVSIRVATHHGFKGTKGEMVDTTTWHNVVAWKSSAEYARRSFVKGSKILVKGQIVYRTFMGRDGQKRFTTLIRASNLINLDR